MLSTYEVARGSLKTYCLNSKNNDCDDTWRPDKLDIDAALVGYDLPSGNLEFCCVVYMFKRLPSHLFFISNFIF